MKIPLEDKINDPFAPKNTRADLTYTPLCKDLKDVVYTGIDADVSEYNERYIKQY
jgi:hypothetical protein